MLNRREFIRNIICATFITMADIEPLVESIVKHNANLTDDEFIKYFQNVANLFITNPGQCGIITNIGINE